MTETLDDHLPPPPSPETKKAIAAPSNAVPRDRVVLWGDRAIFLGVGLLLGFAAAWVMLEKVPSPAAVAAIDPHAGLAMGPGATRDLPGAGGGAPSMPAEDPAVRAAREGFEAAVAKDPKNRELLVKLGNIYFDAERHREAAELYERALAINPKDVNVLTDLGVSYRNLGKFDRALELFDRALAIEPKHWQAAFNKVIVYGIDKGDVTTARKILAGLKRDHPELPELDRLASTLEQGGAGAK